MSKPRSILFTVFIFCLSFSIQSCFLPAQDKFKKPPVLQEQHSKDAVMATVKNYNVDGCTWIIELEDGVKLQPLNLTADFQKDNLPVWISYEIKKNAVGVCMTGEMITISEIELR